MKIKTQFPLELQSQNIFITVLNYIKKKNIWHNYPEANSASVNACFYPNANLLF